MKCDCVVLLNVWPWPLTFQPSNHVTSSISQGHSLYQIWTLWGYLFLNFAADKQTDKQTDSKILPTPTDIVGVGIELHFVWQTELPEAVIIIPHQLLHDLEPLTEGGFGIVYKAEHEDWGTVAYKELKASIIKPETRSVSYLQQDIIVQSLLVFETATFSWLWIAYLVIHFFIHCSFQSIDFRQTASHVLTVSSVSHQTDWFGIGATTASSWRNSLQWKLHLFDVFSSWRI